MHDEHLRNPDMPTPRKRWLRSIVFGFAAAFLFFFWALPEIGHQILLRNNYYSMGDEELFLSQEEKCSDYKSIVKDGKFLEFYTYRSILSKRCNPFSTLYPNGRIIVEIDVQKPHTFFSKFMKLRNPDAITPTYKNIYRKIINL